MKRSILVIEDDHPFSIAVRASLIRAGFHCVVADTGADGLELASSRAFSVILLDVMLPDLDGREICSRLRKSWPDAPIIMVTALGHELDVVAGLNLGADDYVVKPFGFDELLARIEAVIRRRCGPEERSEVRFADVILHSGTRTVTKAGKLLPTTPRDFEILRFFVEHSRKLVTREEVEAILQSAEPSATSRQLDTYVWRIRKLIEDDPRQPLILQTVHGKGYIFTAPVES